MTEQPCHAIPLPVELAGWLAAWRRARDKIRHWQATADAAQEHITAALDAAGATISTIDGQPACKWITVEQRRVDGARLRADHPALADLYSTVITQRRFTTPRADRPSS